MDIRLPEKVRRILRKLEENGYEAYAVGGCIRDSLLGRSAQDWDITTSAEPRQVKALFGRTVDTGIRHGTVTVLLSGEGFEVTTYRIDGEYEDGRHPKQVAFTRDLREDLRRRDFTINAMAYNERSGLIDLFGGADDLARGLLRCVGEPRERFTEDALRILRAFRFSAQLDFEIEEETKRAAQQLAPALSNISAERIRAELDKLLVSEHPGRLLDAADCGLTRVFLPELDEMLATPQRNRNHCYDVGRHTLRSVELIADADRQRARLAELLPTDGTTDGRPCAARTGEARAAVPTDGGDACSLSGLLHEEPWGKRERQLLRWAALLHDVGKPQTAGKDELGEDRFFGHAAAGAARAKQILRRLKFDNETVDVVGRLVAAHDDHRYEKSAAGMRRTMHRLGPELMELLFELQLADVLTQNPSSLPGKLADLALARRLHREVAERGDCVSLAQLAVSGKDLLSVGIPAGPVMGRTLERLLQEVLADPQRNRRETLLALCKKE